MKSNNIIYFILGGIVILGVLGIFAAPAISDIPPTPAFFSINGTDGSINATNYRSNLGLIEGANIDFDFDNTNKELTISASGANINSIHEIGNVTDYTCGLNQILKVNSTGYFECANDETGSGGGNATNLDDLGDVVLTSPSQFSIIFYNGLQWLDQTFKSNSLTCSAGQFFSSFDNQTGDYSCTTPSGSGNMTTLGDAGDATITNPTYPAILFYNSTQWINKTFSINSQSVSANTFISGINNQTGEISTGTISASSVTSLANNVTSALTGTGHTSLWNVALTANSGNTIDGVIVASSNTAGSALQAGANASNANTRGWCYWVTPTTATAEELDTLVVSTANVVDTGTTTWLAGANEALPISFTCTLQTGATGGDLEIYIQAEVASTVSAKAGSYYIKTP